MAKSGKATQLKSAGGKSAAAKGGAAKAAARPLPSTSDGANRLETPTDLAPEAVLAISDALKGTLATVFALYLKTKNFHWHVSGPHFRDYHLLLDEQAQQLFDATDLIAERARKIGGTTLRSIGAISRHSAIADNDADYVAPDEMLLELMRDNKKLVQQLRKARAIADEHDDSGTTSQLEVFIDEAERRTWFLFETARAGSDRGH